MVTLSAILTLTMFLQGHLSVPEMLSYDKLLRMGRRLYIEVNLEDFPIIAYNPCIVLKSLQKISFVYLYRR